jgi:hypothetical protein
MVNAALGMEGEMMGRRNWDVWGLVYEGELEGDGSKTASRS